MQHPLYVRQPCYLEEVSLQMINEVDGWESHYD